MSSEGARKNILIVDDDPNIRRFLSESLRIAEISLGHILSQTPTRLIVARVGNIIENQGGIVSWLKDQILERRVVQLPEEKAKAFLLSKHAAARSIMQALATGSLISPGGQLLTSEPGICLERYSNKAQS